MKGPIRSFNIWVIDPCEAYRIALQWLLDGKGYSCRTLPAWEYEPNARIPREVAIPDVMLIGIPLAPMESWKMISDILHYYPQMKIIGLSLSQDHAVRTTTISKGVQAFLPKSVLPGTLLQEVDRLLSLSGRPTDRNDAGNVPNIKFIPSIYGTTL